jgi:hypothetical protein
LDFGLFYDREFTREPDVRKTVAAVRRDFHVQHEIIAAMFNRIDSQPDIGQPLPNFFRRQLRAGQFAQPLMTNKHVMSDEL